MSIDQTIHHCQSCGGSLSFAEGRTDLYRCRHCRREYPVTVAERYTRTLADLFDDTKQELVHNLRLALYDAVTARHISRKAVVRACDALRAYLPDDFAANFFRAASDTDLHIVNEAINAVDTDENYDDMELVIEFLVRSMTADVDYLFALNNLVERAYKAQDAEQFGKYAAMVSEQAARVHAGVYDPIPRDVFVAYSSKDMDKVFQVVEAIEEQGFTCFVASRNLRHGVGSVENYNQVLREAMDNCRIFLFISSMNSRNMRCDALRVELAYVKEKDLAGVPAEYRNSNYEAIPETYKKRRIEYRLEESRRENVADAVVDEFFGGYERVFHQAELLKRVAKLLVQGAVTVPSPVPTPKPEKVKAEKPTPPSTPVPSKSTLSIPAVGETFFFGTYEQRPGHGKEPIEWLVLDRKGNRALVISKLVLDCMPYNTEYVAIKWKKSSLRRWLNSSFLNAAFTDSERERVLATRIKNPKNASEKRRGGFPTTDSVFCLSIDEAGQYFAPDAARAARATEFVLGQKKIDEDYIHAEKKTVPWLLRTLGDKYDKNAACVRESGKVYAGGIHKVSICGYLGVRPALWLTLES